MMGQWTEHWLKNQGFEVQYFNTVTSTNLIAKEEATLVENPIKFYLAENQTLGRGQGSHRWLNTEPGTNLLMTVSMEIEEPPQPSLCLTLGEILKSACEKSWPQLNWRVKPPNDLYLENKKVAGILLESVSQGNQHRLLFGLGFNIQAHPQSNEFESTDLNAHLESALTESQWNLFLNLFVPQFINDPRLKILT